MGSGDSISELLDGMSGLSGEHARVPGPSPVYVPLQNSQTDTFVTPSPSTEDVKLHSSLLVRSQIGLGQVKEQRMVGNEVSR